MRLDHLGSCKILHGFRALKVAAPNSVSLNSGKITDRFFSALSRELKAVDFSRRNVLNIDATNHHSIKLRFVLITWCNPAIVRIRGLILALHSHGKFDLCL